MQRAADYYDWCGTTTPVTAQYLVNGSEVQSTTYPTAPPPPMAPPPPPMAPPPPPTAPPPAVTTSAELPGPSLALYNSPPYACVTNYYISTNGSDSNDGSSPSTPWATLDHAATAVTTAGSCINIAPGVYERSTQLTLKNGGNSATPTGYIVWRCTTMPFSFSPDLQGEGSGCVIRATGENSGHFTYAKASYLMFDALEFDGGNGSVLNDCIMQISSHHHWILNSVFHGCGANGIGSAHSDWDFWLHNVAHDNTGTQAVNCCGSGIHPWQPVGLAAYTPTDQDNQWCASTPNECFHMVIAYNVIYHNINPPDGHNDGEGVQLDGWDHGQTPCPSTGNGICPYTAATLVMGNLAFNNGGRGFEVNVSANNGQSIYFVNNTAYANSADPLGPGGGGEFNVWGPAFNTYYLNNIAYSVAGVPFSIDGGSGNVWQNNISYPGGRNSFQSPNTYPTTGPNANLDGSDPMFMSASPGSNINSFALQSGSPALGFGQTFSLWQQASPIDAGACVGGLSGCPGPYRLEELDQRR
jgi:hypothetical protein